MEVGSLNLTPISEKKKISKTVQELRENVKKFKVSDLERYQSVYLSFLSLTIKRLVRCMAMKFPSNYALLATSTVARSPWETSLHMVEFTLVCM